MGDTQTTKAAETTRVKQKTEDRPPPEREYAPSAFAATLFRAAGSDDPTTPPDHLGRVLERLAAPHQPGFLLQCQRRYGNAYVQRMISSRDNGHSSPLKQQAYTQEEPIAQQITVPDVATAYAEQASSLDGLQSHAVQAKPLTVSIVPIVRRQKGKDDEEDKRIQSKSAVSPAGGFDAGEEVEARLSQSKGGGSPLPESVRTYMEPRFGVDFSHVHVHTGSDAKQMNQAVGAQAFTHGSDIYFGEGRNPENLELTAHELTHVIQQTGGAPLQTKKREKEVASPGPEFSIQKIGAACAGNDREKMGSTPISHMVQQGGAGKTGITQAKIQRWPDWVSDAADWVSDTASDAAGAVVEGAEYVGGKVVGGARWVGGQVADGARWVGEQISAAAQWVIDQIRSVINSGTNYLTEQWGNIKQFGSSCFDTIKTGFGNLVHFVTNPLSSLMSALSAMNADLLGSVWSLLKTGANALWEGINSVINGVLQSGEGIWSTVSGFVNGIFNTIAGLFDNSAFDLLPDFIKQEARSILNGLRSLWNQVSTFWTDLWQRLTSSAQEILAGVRSFVDNVLGFSIDSVINMVRDLKEVYDYVMKFFADPRATIQPFLDQIAAKLNTEAPPRANALGNQVAQENYQGGATPTTANGNIQRQKSDSEERDTASLDEVGKGILYYIEKFWTELDIKQMLWQTVVNSFWPPATIAAICKQFSDLWNDHWATTVDSLYTPRNFFDEPIGCLHDIWSNFLILLDFPLSLWRTLNHIAGLLIGYVTILVVLVEAILGGIAAAEVGVVPGLLAGAAAGLATMVPIAEALIASYLLAESSTVVIILVRLFTAQQTCEKRQVDISTSVASFIAMAVALVLQVLMALLAELVNLIASVLKGAPKPAPQPQPQPVAPPAQPGLPPPTPSPIPASPQPQPVPVQPTVPAQPAAPGGGGQVIPFPGRRAPVPVTPSVPGRVAAKFEDGVSQAPFLETRNNNSSAETADNFDTIRESNPENGGISLSDIQDAEDGIVQTARKDKIDPDACKDPCSEDNMRKLIGNRSVAKVISDSMPGDKINEKRVKPNQDLVEKNLVVKYASQECNGSPFPVIDLYPGKDYTVIDEGHHRFVASRLRNKQISISGTHRPIDYDPEKGNFADPFEWKEVDWL